MRTSMLWLGAACLAANVGMLAVGLATRNAIIAVVSVVCGLISVACIVALWRSE